MKTKQINRKRITGQGMSEYLIIIGLVAVAGIGVMAFFGQTIQNQVAGMATEISGQDATAQIANAAASAGEADAKAQLDSTLANYNEKNR